MLTELPFQPGVIKDEEFYSARGFATDSQLTRWVRGRAEALGGWTEVLSGIQGKVRAMHEWTLSDGRPYLAIATSEKLYVFDGSRLLNITPYRSLGGVGASPVSTTNGSSIVTITDTNHGAMVGDTVFLSSLAVVAGIQVGGPSYTGVSNPFMTTVGSRLVVVQKSTHGLVDDDDVSFVASSNVGGFLAAEFSENFRIMRINASKFQIEMLNPATSTATGGGSTDITAARQYRILSVIDANSYTIDAVGVANATTTGGGASGSGIYEISIGRESSASSSGYGGGDYGSGVYGGDSLIDTIPIPLRQWSLDNFGNTLMACVSGGVETTGGLRSIFHWPHIVTGERDRAFILTDAPAQVRCIVSTPERFLLACGCTNEDDVFDPMLVRHTTGEDATVWIAASDNSAGDFPVSGGSRIVGTVRRETGPMIFTDGGLNAVRTIGSPDQIYKAEQVGVDCGLIGMHAVCQRDSDLYWITPACQFYAFRGGRPAALENPNREWFEDRLVKLQAEKIFAWPDRRFEAVAWHFPAADDNEPGEYLRLDVPESRRNPMAGWSVGTMDRTACSAGYVFQAKKPLAVSRDGILYQHEDGFSAAGAAVERFLQWAPIDLRDGQTRATVNRVQIDMTLEDPVTVLLGFREWPRGPASTKELTITPTTQKCDRTGAGRQVDMRVQSTGTKYWRVGATRADIVEGTRR